MDMVQFREPIMGYSPLLREEHELAEGTEALVVDIIGEEGLFKLQVSDLETGLPTYFVEAHYDQLRLS